MIRLWPRKLAGQLIASLLLVLLAAQIVTLLIFHDERRAAVRATTRAEILSRTAAVVRLINETPARYHHQVIRSASGPRLRFSLDPQSLLPSERPKPGAIAVQRRLENLLGADARSVRVAVHARGARERPQAWRYRDRDEAAEDDEDNEDDDHQRLERKPRIDGEGRNPKRRRNVYLGLTISVLPRAGPWLNVQTLIPPPPPSWAVPSVVTLGGTAVALVFIVVLMVRRATHPLGELANAAERLGRGEQISAVEERGPEDVRVTIRAFNDMRARLERFVRQRTQMLAAISHDLRTPITSLRLRAELVEDDENRERILASLDEMQSMAEATLDFVRGESADEKTRSVDLGALIESVCADLADLGHDVSVGPMSGISYPCRVHALKRAVRNLVENAVTYGKRARISLERAESDLLILVEDDGPGIPSADLQRVTEPFVRLEESRSRDTGGIGMGLAIAASIVHSHGGRLSLRNRPEGGLRAELRLPQAASVT